MIGGKKEDEGREAIAQIVYVSCRLRNVRKGRNRTRKVGVLNV